jgi:hypothetical protein
MRRARAEASGAILAGTKRSAPDDSSPSDCDKRNRYGIGAVPSRNLEDHVQTAWRPGLTPEKGLDW